MHDIIIFKNKSLQFSAFIYIIIISMEGQDDKKAGVDFKSTDIGKKPKAEYFIKVTNRTGLGQGIA